MIDTNPYTAYDNAANKIRDSILLARQNKHRQGHLSFIVESLTFLRAYAVSINKPFTELTVIDSLSKEFENLLNVDDSMVAKTSSLGELLTPQPAQQSEATNAEY